METLLFSDFNQPEIGIHIQSHLIGTAAAPHRHDFYEIALVVSGEISHMVNGSRQELRQGDLTLVRPDDGHMLQAARHASIVNLAFSPKVWDGINMLLSAPLAALEDSVLPPVKNTAYAYPHFMSELSGITALPWNSLRWEYKAKSVIGEMLCFLIQPPGRALPVWLSRLIAEMEKPENFILGTERLFELSGKTQEHVSRQFQKHLDTTPTHFINKLRIRFAMNRLILTDDPVINICYDAGFNNLAYFYRLFKKETSLPPKRYRSQNRMKLT